MPLKPPSPETGAEGLAAFRAAAKLYEGSLRNRSLREFYRKDLAKWQKLYATLAAKRPSGSPAAAHFAKLSALCGALLAEYGPESPPKVRARKGSVAVALSYPDFPDEISHRIHFFEGPGLRRQRAIELAAYAPAVSRQTSGRGRVLLSVGVRKDQVRLFHRLVEAIGELASDDVAAAGFDIGYVMRPDGIAPGESWTANPVDPALPIARIWQDNGHAMGYSHHAWLLGSQWRGSDGKGLPDDLPAPDAGPWDPDPHWQRVLKLTETDRLEEALALVEEVPGHAREPLFDEVLYLRFLTKTPLRAQDVRVLARKHAATSSIAGRLLEEFERFLDHLDAQLALDPPILSDMTGLQAGFVPLAIPPMPPPSDWAACRRHIAQFINPSSPRGRIFSRNMGVADVGASAFFAQWMVAAEDAFRRERGVPEIGRGWASEVALLDLVRTIWPSAVHQWRPAFLGLQSIDIHVPELQLAIEYQGQQHYEPITLFGGEEGLAMTQARDERKRALLAHQGVRLLEWRFDEPMTRARLVARLAEMGIGVPD
ncbi:hypothetical protein [Croceicoccus sp. BE223]|uniref:hypothetical protein n=1 Tax=Croceicoccus sp. BE223 TaxID=2817716 RepID=UPI002862E587|nr:hypothetical protein [Croceicoccus sp. BE223]MDR7103983.1 hypothetical protein [Croceicoccus sp. BE223]